MIVVTGSSGFIGRAVVSQLLAREERVVGVDIRPADGTAGSSSGLFTEEICDLQAEGAFDELIQRHRPDTIVALAESLQADVGSLVSGGVAGVTRVLESAQSHGVRRVCLASSITVYLGLAGPFREDMPLPIASPLSISAIKKAEEIAGRWFGDQLGLDVVVMRLSNIYGPRYRSMRNAPSRYLFDRLQRSVRDAPTMMSQQIYEQMADFCHVDDCACGISLVATADRLSFDTYNIGGGEGVTDEALRWAADAAIGGNTPRPETSPVANYMEITRAVEDLGYAPAHDIATGMKAYREWLVNNPH